MHVQSVLRRSLSNSESTIKPETEVENEDPEPSMHTMPLAPSENLSFLVEIRRRHQTKEAEKGVRLASTSTKPSRDHISSDAPEEQNSERRLLAQKIRDIVKEVDDNKEMNGSSTGLNRRIRWTKTPGLYSPSLALSIAPNEGKSGNSANALEVSQKAANLVGFPICLRQFINGTQSIQIVKKRRTAFAGLPHAEDLANAKVNALTMLQRGSYGIVSFENDLMICKGETLWAHYGFDDLTEDHTTNFSADHVREGQWKSRAT